MGTKRWRNGVLAATIVFVVLSGVAEATLISVNANSRGSYGGNTGAFSTGGAGTATGNYLTGQFSGIEHRSFFVFDLSAISGTIVSATFDVALDQGGMGDPFETLALFDYTSSIAALTAGTAGLAGFGDLGTGTGYASQIIATGTTSGTATLVLNAAALADLNSAIGGNFAIGGIITTIAGGGDQYLFGFSLGNPLTTLTLDVVVPEPATMTLLGIGLVGFALRRRKMKA